MQDGIFKENKRERKNTTLISTKDMKGVYTLFSLVHGNGQMYMLSLWSRHNNFLCQSSSFLALRDNDDVALTLMDLCAFNYLFTGESWWQCWIKVKRHCGTGRWQQHKIKDQGLFMLSYQISNLHKNMQMYICKFTNVCIQFTKGKCILRHLYFTVYF